MFKDLEKAALNAEVDLGEVLDALKFNDQGLLPAVAQDVDSGEVLMLAWMNREAIEESLRTGAAIYYSRSRQQLWRKGETSGHVQALKELRIDCDGDAILLRVEQTGPACHTNRKSCFYLAVEGGSVRVTSEPR